MRRTHTFKRGRARSSAQQHAHCSHTTECLVPATSPTKLDHSAAVRRPAVRLELAHTRAVEGHQHGHARRALTAAHTHRQRDRASSHCRSLAYNQSRRHVLDRRHRGSAVKHTLRRSPNEAPTRHAHQVTALCRYRVPLHALHRPRLHKLKHHRLLACQRSHRHKAPFRSGLHHARQLRSQRARRPQRPTHRAQAILAPAQAPSVHSHSRASRRHRHARHHSIHRPRILVHVRQRPLRALHQAPTSLHGHWTWSVRRSCRLKRTRPRPSRLNRTDAS
mmetsp:Transcript_4634/g.15997  ORF Transcript_4634/g.15997 Transcript_4634/m.15997 type:complete len:277 (-) Transcript_4634:51-881(-)